MLQLDRALMMFKKFHFSLKAHFDWGFLCSVLHCGALIMSRRVAVPAGNIFLPP